MDISHMSAAALKDSGNKYYGASQFSKALECYSKAIEKQPNISVYYTNRALCYLRLHDIDRVIQDCRTALEHDAVNIKAYYFMGQAYMELGAYDEALHRMFRAHELSLEQRKNCGDDITAAIRLVKRKRFEAIDEKRRQEEIELQVYLESLIRAEGERRLQSCCSEKTPASSSDGCGDPQERQSSISSDTQKRIAQVADLFAQIDDRRKKREVPDYLCGRISFELLRDPVVTPSGITYDRRSIVEHLQRVGHFDPITRQSLTEDKLIPNIVMKEVVDAFVEENPWAEDDY